MNTKVIAGVIAGVSITAAVGWSVYDHRRLERSIEKLTGKIVIDVTDPYISEAVDNAVERQTSKRIATACTKAVDAVSDDIHKEVRKEVKAVYSDLKGDVKKEMQKQVKDISVEGIRQEVIDEAKEEAIKKLQSDMDVILKDYNTNLENMSKIYANIAKTLEGANQKKDMTFTIG